MKVENKFDLGGAFFTGGNDICLLYYRFGIVSIITEQENEIA